MPLDTGAIIDDVFASATIDAGRLPPRQLGVRDGKHVGEVLQSARNFIGLTLDEVSERTAVKPSYLKAIEAMDLAQLPSRPFVIGFIRAFAEAVGVEPDLAVARFKSDNPERNQPLREPLGVGKRQDGRARLVIAIGIVVFAAILAWNVVQRAVSTTAAPSAVVVDTPGNRRPSAPISGQNPVALGAPTAPPPEATTPEPYQTPGMDKVMAASDAAAGVVTSEPGARAVVPPAGAASADAPATFKAAGRVYGAPANASLVTLQARKSGTVILHMPDGAVVGMQVLQKGEAVRLPNNAALSVDVSDPAGFDVYVGGALHAGLAAAVTPLAKIGAAPAPNTHAGASRR